MKTRLLLLVQIFVFLGLGNFVNAQESQILSVTPPLFQLSVNPGDIWQSNIKVVNGNSYPLTVFTEVANFSPIGEFGQGKFIPVLPKNDPRRENTTLAEWIEISEGPHVIPPEQTKDVSFFVDIPDNASPGGHYAAILVSTAPPESNDPLSVTTSQAVTSLFFARIQGEVDENGSIREYRVLDSLLETPSAEFVLRFENKGNVHLLPRGEIRIFNMWGTERGVIPINNQTQFGNVLPNSIREFKFAWDSEFSITDIGRYKAELTLVYGEDGVKNASADAYFYVLPIKGTLITLAVLLLFILLVVWMVKAYIRKMLTLAGVDVEYEKTVKKEIKAKDTTRAVKNNIKYKNISAPIKNGVLDLRTQLSAVDEGVDFIKTIVHFVGQYKMFFISVTVLIVMFIAGVMYISMATEEHTRYNVTIEEGGEIKTISGDEINQE